MTHKKRSWRNSYIVLLLVSILVVAGCGSGKNNEAGTENEVTDNPTELQKVQLVLDYTPNTNHTGLYVARDNGYFAEQGLEVEIIAPGESGASAVVAAGTVPFGIGYQEAVTQARIAGLPLVSLAAIIQHNTSGFASPKEKGIDSPKKFEGMRYGGWGDPVDQAVIEALMKAEQADFSKVDLLSIGDGDFFAAVKRDIDFAWIFYAWTGIEAELRGVDLNMIYLTDYTDKLDYYTPLVMTNEKMIAEQPETVKAFVAAVAKGYQYAIDQPTEAAEVLIKAVPELDAELVRASQAWLSPRYQDDAPRWGEQKLSVWENYAEWMLDSGLLDSSLEAEKAFTNDFLPAAK
ncbi:ABC transporter substrate-binding protein [Paenibacillus yanchengensis]|uniref:ABC transporter substrate-binding protein n=1 Tax=Paenibacillus yanchengensis TaxID=2035833 RepID=A0ABW4YME2_9BACL